MIQLLRIIHKTQYWQFHEATICSLLNLNGGNAFVTNHFGVWVKTFIHTEQWWILYYRMTDKQLEITHNIKRAFTGQWGSVQPSSCTLVSGSFLIHFSSATEMVCLCLLGGLDVTEQPWRRTLSFQSGYPSAHLWAVCTCTPRRGRCWGTWPWNQLQKEINKLLIHPETRARVLEAQLNTN